jgi:hypothetical protein
MKANAKARLAPAHLCRVSDPGASRPRVGRHSAARSTPALGRPLRQDHLPPPSRRRAPAIHVRDDHVPGVTIAGTGRSLGDRDRADGTRWSGLKFWATDRRSIIDTGAGYWRYIPTDDGVRFLTRYNYRPRWGRLGELIDRWAFRPLFGWATA